LTDCFSPELGSAQNQTAHDPEAQHLNIVRSKNRTPEFVLHRLARCKNHLKRLDEWIRRKLRCIRLKQCKRVKTIADFLISLGVKEFGAWMLALSGKGWWRMALAWSSHQAMNLEWFEQQGLVSLSQRYEVFQLKRNRRGTEQVCLVV